MSRYPIRHIEFCDVNDSNKFVYVENSFGFTILNFYYLQKQVQIPTFIVCTKFLLDLESMLHNKEIKVYDCFNSNYITINIDHVRHASIVQDFYTDKQFSNIVSGYPIIINLHKLLKVASTEQRIRVAESI